MLFKSNKFFDLKSKRTSVKLVKSINLCQFFNFLLHITGKSCHILRFNYLEMCHILVYLYQGFPQGGGVQGGGHPLPHLTIFFRKPLLSNFEELPPCLEHLWETLYIYVKLRYITAPKVSFLEFHTPRFCDRHIFSLFLTKHVELAQFLLFCNGTFTILMLNFSI